MCTLVTAFYITNTKKHSLTDYQKAISSLLTLSHCPIVLFTDKSCSEFIYKTCFNKLKDILIINFPMEQFYTYRFLDYWEKDFLRDKENFIHVKELYMIWNEKSMFVKKAIDLNPFGTEFFCWTDIGIIQNDKLSPTLKRFPKIRGDVKKDKVYILNLNLEPELRYMETNFDLSKTVGGGIFLGHKTSFMEWIREYYIVLEEYMRRDMFAGKDQNIMADTCLKNKNLVELIKPMPTPVNNDWFYLLYYFS